MRYNKNTDWFEMWEQDKKSILCTMYNNLSDDLNAGYNPVGNCIKRQREMIDEYSRAINKAYDLFKTMDDEQVNKWCFYELKKSGAIE